MQPVISKITDILGQTSASVSAKIGAEIPALPAGITVDAGGVHVDVNCATRCEALASGVIDLGGGKTLPCSGRGRPRNARLRQARARLWPARRGVANGAGWGLAIRTSARCSPCGCGCRPRRATGSSPMRCRVRHEGDVRDEAPAGRDGAQGDAPDRHDDDVQPGLRAARAVPGSSRAANTIIASTRSATFKPAGSGKTKWTGTWTLRPADALAVRKARRGGFKGIRFVVSAHASAGGVTTIGSSTFRAGKR